VEVRLVFIGLRVYFSVTLESFLIEELITGLDTLLLILESPLLLLVRYDCCLE